jgi:Fur family ferric uptake transcriptional regulator
VAGSTIAREGASSLKRAIAKLKSAGLRITQPRIAILTALHQREQLTSIEQLHAALAEGSCDLVTVYRCIGAFEKIGLVRRAFFHNGTALYELNLEQTTRYHVVCRTTNRVTELNADTSAELGSALNQVENTLRGRGYADVSHIVEFFGVAP